MSGKSKRDSTKLRGDREPSKSAVCEEMMTTNIGERDGRDWLGGIKWIGDWPEADRKVCKNNCIGGIGWGSRKGGRRGIRGEKNGFTF